MRDTHDTTPGWRRIGAHPLVAEPADREPPGPGAELTAPVFFEGVRHKRVLAFLIDFCLLLALSAVWWVFGWIFSLLTLFLAWPLVALGAVLLPLAYHSYFIGAAGNATPGMRVMGVRVLAWNGNEVSFPQAILQTLVFYATVPLTHGLVLLVSLFNERGRCLHDLLCGTVVVNVTDRPVLIDDRA